MGRTAPKYTLRHDCVREGINGQCSLAMAYRLRNDGIVVQDLQRILAQLALLSAIRGAAEASS